MKKFNWEDETLCCNNLQVKHDLQQIKKRLKELGIKDEELSAYLNEGLEVLRVMKKQGQKLEDRCVLYRKSVEQCGFVRVKKGKKRPWDKE